MTPARPAATFFATAAAFRRWLAKHAATERELIVGFHKVDSGLPSLTWPQSVDEALCYGWIDGVRKRIDETSYQIRFTPRRPNSIWSAINIAKVEAMRAAGKMTPAGESAFARRTDKKSVVYAYEQESEAALTPTERTAFRKAKGAWKFLESCPPSYRRVVFHWIVTARKPETRAARVQKLVAACAAGKRL